MGHPWVTDAAAVALDDRARQYIGVVLQLNDAGHSELQDLGRKDVNDKIKQWLRKKMDPIAVPKKFRYENEIPVDAQGKRQQATIRKLFDQQ